MTAPEGLACGDWVWAVFPQLAGKRRPSVFVARLEAAKRQCAAVVPATAELGHVPGALAIPTPPAEGLRACRLITTQMSLLRLERLEPVGGRLSDAKRAALIALIVERFGADWADRAVEARSATPLRPRSAAARRRANQRGAGGI